MEKREELALFLERAEEFIDGKYILADIKIVNLLKTIVASETLLAIFKNCLADFNFEQAQKKYLVKSKYLSTDKGEFILPTSSRELLAFTFTLLAEIDAKRIDFGQFINKYFYEDGSFSAGYSAFINSLIKPFRNSVKLIMESVIDGKVEDPIEAFTKEEERRAKEKEEQEKRQQKEKELSKKVYGESIKQIKKFLLDDKTKIKNKSAKLKERLVEETLLVIDMLANVIESDDKDAIMYAYISYKYVAKAHPILFFNRIKKIEKLIKDVINELN